MLKRLIILLLLLTSLQANYSAGEAGFAMGSLASYQSATSYANTPGLYFVFETEVLATGTITVLARPLVSENITSWTNQPVEIKLIDNNPATWNAALQYRLDNALPWENYTAPFVVTGNSILYARALNTTLNLSSEIELTINNIDTDLPQVSSTVNSLDYDKTLYKISLSASDGSSGIKEIIAPDGYRTQATNAEYVVTQSGLYNFQISDLAGNQVRYAVTVSINQLSVPAAGSTIITKVTRPLAYPSIFDPDRQNTRLYFELNTAGEVLVKIYDLGGNPVESMSLDGVAGINSVEWDGRSSGPHNQLDSGVYLFYIVNKGGRVYGRGKVILMRDSK